MSPLLITFSSHPNFYKYALPLFVIYLFDDVDMKLLKHHGALLSLLFLLKSKRVRRIGVLTLRLNGLKHLSTTIDVLDYNIVCKNRCYSFR